MKKRTLLTALGVLCISTLLCGCGNADNNSTEGATPSASASEQITKTTTEASKTDAEIFVEKYRLELDKSINVINTQYSDVYSDAKYYAKGNSVIYEYTYRKGLEKNAQLIDKKEAQKATNTAKANDERQTGLSFDEYIYIYNDYNGNELIRFTSDNTATTPNTQTNAQIFIEKYKNALDASMTSTMQIYSETYSEVTYYADGNDVVFEYTYHKGKETLASSVDLDNAQDTINAAKTNDEKVSSLSFDHYVYIYLDSDGKEVLRITSDN